MDRDSLQTWAADKLIAKKRLICQWATGCGKTGVVLKFLTRRPAGQALILVPETNNISNWTDEFAKFGVPMFGVTIACYASLHKFKDTMWDLLVLDEAPHTNTDLKYEILSSITAEYVLALGAVISEDELSTLRSLYGTFAMSSISLDRAIKMDILPSPHVAVIHMQLDDVKKDFWHKGKVYTEKGLYDALNDNVRACVAAFSVQASTFNKLRMQRAGTERKRFLGERKQAALEKICNKLNEQNKRYLCFCVSVKQAEALGGRHAFTAKTPESERLLERFNNHEINSLFVVGKLIEGQTLNDIHCGVIGQLGNSNRITIQEIGRIMRSKEPVIYVPIFDDTKDDGFLYTVTNNIAARYVKHYKF